MKGCYGLSQEEAVQFNASNELAHGARECAFNDNDHQGKIHLAKAYLKGEIEIQLWKLERKTRDK